MTIELEPKTHERTPPGEVPDAQGMDPAGEHALHDHMMESDPPDLRKLERSIANFPRFLLLLLVRFYQLTISRALPANTCRFYPTCSHYGYEAVYKYGAFKGGWMAFKRILRCQPFNPGGYDPVP